MGKVNKDIVEGLKGLLKGVVESIVDEPSKVHINVVPAAYRLLAELHTDPDDVGQVIGRKGTVVGSIRTILAAFGGKHGIKVDLSYVTEREKDAANGRY
tara:strand:- start:4070 stop:4366 length:297 start_codon:yes stop_codon:yes gene_type:complete